MIKAVKRVIRNHKTAGFVLNNGSRDYFSNLYNIEQNIKNISNLTKTSNGIVRAKHKLEEVGINELNTMEYNRIKHKNPLERDIQNDLAEWKNKTGHRVLMLEGSRQIGKTTEILKFAYINYESIVYVNLSDDKYGFTSIVNNGDTIGFIEDYCNKANIVSYEDNSNTILIIDEIQVSRGVYNCIRRMDNELECDIIVTGSYLGQALQKDYFQAVGNITPVKMYSLSFNEFCRIFKLEDTLLNLKLNGESDEDDYNKLYRLYDIYIKIGGYPAVVMGYIKCRDVEGCMDIIAEILFILSKESANYFHQGEEEMVFSEIYKYVINCMCSNKRGNKDITGEIEGNILDKYKNSLVTRKELNKALSWLISCGILGICRAYNADNRYGLYKGKKIYFTDCGIANYIGGSMRGDSKGNIDGIITETFVYCEFMRLFSNKPSKKIVKGNYVEYLVYGDYELDFLIESNKGISYGIEVKATTGVPKSLQVIAGKGLIDKAVVAKRTKGGNTGGILTIPIFTAGCRFPYE